MRQQLPTAFYALRPWRHNRFWVDLREARTLPDATTLSVRARPHPASHASAHACAPLPPEQSPPSRPYPQVHRVYNSMLAKVSAARFALRNGANASSYVQYDCGKCSEWGWQQGTSKFACCMKRPCAANDLLVPLLHLVVLCRLLFCCTRITV